MLILSARLVYGMYTVYAIVMRRFGNLRVRSVFGHLQPKTAVSVSVLKKTTFKRFSNNWFTEPVFLNSYLLLPNKKQKYKKLFFINRLRVKATLFFPICHIFDI